MWTFRKRMRLLRPEADQDEDAGAQAHLMCPVCLLRQFCARNRTLRLAVLGRYVLLLDTPLVAQPPLEIQVELLRGVELYSTKRMRAAMTAQKRMSRTDRLAGSAWCSARTGYPVVPSIADIPVVRSICQRLEQPIPVSCCMAKDLNCLSGLQPAGRAL